MRNLLYATGALLTVAAAVPAWGGEFFVIENGPGSKSIAVKQETAPLAAVPAMPNGKPNQGFDYGMLYDLPGAGTRVMRGHVDAKGAIAVHDGQRPYVLYVISGSGKMTLNDKAGTQVGEITYKPDDVIVFQPDTMHGWANGDAAFEFLGVELPATPK